MASIFVGDVYLGITVPVATFVLAAMGVFVMLKNGAVVFRPRLPVVFMALVLCVPIIQSVFGPAPTRFDVGSYLPLIYGAVAFQILSFLPQSGAVIRYGIQSGGLLLCALILASALVLSGSTEIIPGQSPTTTEMALSESLAQGTNASMEPRRVSRGAGDATVEDTQTQGLYRYKQYIQTALGSSNYLAVFLLTAFSVSLFSGNYVLSAIFFASVVATMSRFGMAFLFVPPVLLLARSKFVTNHPGKALLACAAAVSAVGLLVVLSGLHTLGWQSVAVRLGLYQSAIDVIQDNWLIGAPRSAIVTTYEYPANWHPHNWVLWSMAFVGLLGTIWYVAYAGSIGRLIWKLREDRVWAGVGAAGAALLLWGLVEIIFMTPAVSILFGALGGLAWAAVKSSDAARVVT